MCVLYVFSLYYSYVVSLLRDAMLARYLLSPCVRLSVHHKEITQKIRVLPSGTLSQALDLRKFRYTGSLSRCQ